MRTLRCAARREANDIERAEVYLRSAADANPRDPSALHALGKFLRTARQDDDGAMYTYMPRPPARPSVRPCMRPCVHLCMRACVRACYVYQEGLWSSAAEVFLRRALANDDKFVPALHSLAKLTWRVHRDLLGTQRILEQALQVWCACMGHCVGTCGDNCYDASLQIEPANVAVILTYASFVEEVRCLCSPLYRFNPIRRWRLSAQPTGPFAGPSGLARPPYAGVYHERRQSARRWCQEDSTTHCCVCCT